MIGLYREIVVSVYIQGQKYSVKRVIPAALPVDRDLLELDKALAQASADIWNKLKPWEEELDD